MDAVLPLRLSGDYQGYDLERARILTHSLDHFWVDSSPLRLIVISPAADVPAIRAALRPRRLKMIVVQEELLLPNLNSLPNVRGWFRQMALKLAAHKLVHGNFFLTLDADLICTQPLSRNHLFHEGRALTDWEPRALHQPWWDGSAAALGLTTSLEDGPLGMSVTPQLLFTPILQALEHLLHFNGGAEAWMKMLRRPGLWSEYSLYTLFAEHEKILHQYHLDAAWMQTRRKALRANENVWFSSQFPQWVPARAFAPDACGFFSVCQSSTLVDPSLVWAQVAPYIPGSPF